MRLTRLVRWADVLARFLVAWPETRHGVLITAAGGLGDTVLLSMILPRLAAAIAREGEPVTVLLRADAAPMAFLLPPHMRIIAVDFKRLDREGGYRLAMMMKLRRYGFRAVMSADFLRHPYLDEALIRACDAPETVAIHPRPWQKYDRQLLTQSRRYTKVFDSGPVARDKMLRWTAFAAWLDGQTELPPIIRLSDSLLPPPALLPRPTIMIQPFSAVAMKQSGVALYQTILDGLPGFDFVIKGGPDDMRRNPEFQILMDRGARFDSSSFKDALPLIRGASLVISVDTAMMHLATGVGTPTLCLASAAHVGEMVPYAPEITPDNVTFLWHDMPCRGCLGRCHLPLVDARYPCVAQLDPTLVVETARRMLEKKMRMA